MNCSRQPDGQSAENPQPDKFHGVDRDKIDWHPVIDESKCIGCGMCVTTCGRGVYRFDYKKRKAMVVNPTKCMVACQTCANLCPVKAITFAKKGATREKAQKIVSDFQLLSETKQELEDKKERLEI